VLAAVQAEEERVRPHRRHPLTAREARYAAILDVHEPTPDSFDGMPASFEVTTALALATDDQFPDDESPWGQREALTLDVLDRGAGKPYLVEVNGNARLLGRARVERALAHLVALLERGVEDPSVAVGAVDLLVA